MIAVFTSIGASRRRRRKIAQAAAPEIDAELAEITGGAVTGINQIAKLLKWLQAQGAVNAAQARQEDRLKSCCSMPSCCRRRCGACSSCARVARKPQ